MKFENFRETQDKKAEYKKPIIPERALFPKSLPPQTPQLSYNEIPQGMNLSVLQQNLGNCLQIIDDEVMKGYRVHLSDLPIVPLDQDTKLSLKDIQFFRISELVYQENEFSVYALSTMFHALSNKPCTLVLMIKSNGLQNDFYLGVRSLDRKI